MSGGAILRADLLEAILYAIAFVAVMISNLFGNGGTPQAEADDVPNQQSDRTISE